MGRRRPRLAFFLLWGVDILLLHTHWRWSQGGGSPTRRRHVIDGRYVPREIDRLTTGALWTRGTVLREMGLLC